MVLWNLFQAFLKIGLFAIGGAYSFLPLIEKEVVENFHWLTKEEFLDILGVVKIFPGAISIKFATYTGYKIAGIPGAIAANIGNLFCPVILIIFTTSFYAKYKDLPGIKGAFAAVQLAVFSMIIAVAFQLVNIEHLIQWKGLLLVIVCFVCYTYTKANPALIIIGAGLIGAILR